MFSENNGENILFSYGKHIKNNVANLCQDITNPSSTQTVETKDIPVDIVTWAQKFIDSIQAPPERKIIIMEYLVNFFGFLIGASSAYIMYPLAADFGSKTCNLINLNNEEGRKFIQTFFGVTSVAPMISLGAINVQDSFDATIKYFTRPKPSNKGITKKEHIVKTVSRGLFFLAAPFSSIPQSTLTWNTMGSSNPLRLIVTATAVIGPTFFNGRAGQRVIDKLGKKSDSANILQKRLMKNVKIISKMAPEEFGEFIEKFFSSEKQVTEEGLKSLFKPHESGEVQGKQEKNFKRQVCSWGGFTLGALASVIHYELTIDGMKSPMNIDSNGFQIFSALLSYMLNASLGAIFTQDRFEDVYDWFSGKPKEIETDWPKTRKTFFALAIFFGIFSSVSFLNLQIDQAMEGSVMHWLLVLPAFLGPFCIRSKALESLLNRFLDALVKFMSSSNSSEEVENVKEIVVQLGKELCDKIPSLTDEIQKKMFHWAEIEKSDLVSSSVLPLAPASSSSPSRLAPGINEDMEKQLLLKRKDNKRSCPIF